MNYFSKLMPYEFKNVHKTLEPSRYPVLVRVDVNCPVGRNGRITQRNGEVNLRLEENAYLLKAYGKLGPLILMAHQGRKTPPPGKKPDKDFVNLLDHHLILSQISGIRIHFVEYTPGETWKEYSDRLIKQAENTLHGEALLMDNVRIWNFEKEYTPDCPYIPLFRELNPAAFINDGLPLWHRDDASLMFARHVTHVYIGHISMELRTQRRIMHDDGRKIMVIGGKKPKFEAIPRLVERMDILTAGVAGILTVKLSGYEVGPKNEELLAGVFKGMEKEVKRYQQILEDYKIGYPLDFTLSQPENLLESIRHNVQLRDLSKPEWEEYGIYDIGKETVKQYTEVINTGGYDWRISAGPNGVYEENFNHGIRLIENIMGTGFVALGGDTVEELQHNDLCKPIMYSDGIVLLGGGSHVEGFAGMPYPCIEDLIEYGNP